MSTKEEALKLALEALETCDGGTSFADPYQRFDKKLVGKAIAAIKQALAQPVQEPDWLDKEKLDADWDHVWLLVKAASYASSRGHISGTTNWGAAMSAYLRHESKAAAHPAPVPTRVTEEMHAAAVKVLHRANGVDGLPQRMLDAMLAVQATAPDKGGAA